MKFGVDSISKWKENTLLWVKSWPKIISVLHGSYYYLISLPDNFSIVKWQLQLVNNCRNRCDKQCLRNKHKFENLFVF